MDAKKPVSDKLKAYGYAIYYSLSHSHVRMTLLLGLKRLGGTATIAELSEYTGVSYTNVRRAVFGHERTYNINMSLASTGLVTADENPDADARIIALTGRGSDVAKTLEEANFGKTAGL